MKITKQQKNVLLIALAFAIGGAIGGAMGWLGNKKGSAADFKVLNERGQSVQLSDYQGRPVVVNFWATWCKPCLSELPAFENAYSQYKKDVQFMMVNLTTWEDTKSVSYVKEFLMAEEYNFPAFFDTTGEAAETYNMKSIPLTLFIDESGELAYKHSGAMSETQLKNYIEEYLL